ncbi:putative MFS transporter [Saccharopolyspora erythraea NRRL 2338]|uniref:Major facilitator superfamily MFS_1 n=2 Tax=Saccharopolyspora erythraea TaxID=1836 RepID=A4FGV8_SACEN|nr:MFS transporter [Saccharopolyspora erythraea]EQD82609.1 major facilitator transporter [Saccharopolyspora erythraea D]PFG96987.1 putative MFS transporter [Saccharopolyspora erythraea NRRL 2338]QRK87202.1 MFS transporter [Saccharopolyspora erythraea]CAM03283.1 major facilitator superfamily MFS_1 [Saccharopolyspora erythraea NRRL 2338]
MKTGDQVVQELPWKWNTQGTIFLIGGLGFMFDAWDVTLNGFLIPLVGAEWGLSPGARGWVGTSNLIGMAVGAIVWGWIADTIGRRRAFSLTLLMFSLFSVAGAASPDFVTFCVFRFLAGVGLGGCIPVDYALVGEFTPAKVRGKVLTAMDVWWPIGATLCGVVSAGLIVATGSWRMLLLVMVLPALLLFWVRRSVPESPMYLVRKGRGEEARAVIDALVRRTGATAEPWVLPEPAPKAKLSPRALGGQLRDLWRFSAGITSASWALFLTVFLVYYGALTWLPSILISQGYGNYAAFMVTTLMTAIGIVGVLVSAWLVDVVGRKWVIGASGPLAALSLVLFAYQLDIDFAAKAWITAFGFLIELTIPALYAYVSELYPTELRASGFGWASTVSRIGAGFVPLIFGSLLWPHLGLPMTFAVIGVLLLLASLWMAVAAPETKGRELDEIGAQPSAQGAS